MDISKRPTPLVDAMMQHEQGTTVVHDEYWPKKYQQHARRLEQCVGALQDALVNATRPERGRKLHYLCCGNHRLDGHSLDCLVNNTLAAVEKHLKGE